MTLWTGGARAARANPEVTRGVRPEAWLEDLAKGGPEALVRDHRAIVHGSPTFLHFFENGKKNRDSELPLYDDSRVVLQPLEREKAEEFHRGRGYIHASLVPAPDPLILTQEPLPTLHAQHKDPLHVPTVADFWRMVHQQNVNVIVALGPLAHMETAPQGDPQTHSYFHPKQGKSVTFKPHSKVMTKKVTEGVHLTRRELRHVFKLEKKMFGGKKVDRTVVHLAAEWWVAGEGLPELASVLALVEAAVEESAALAGTAGPAAQHPPVLVHCLDGGKRSGLFAALFRGTLELMKSQGKVDIRGAARSVRLARFGTLPHLQYTELWRGLTEMAARKGLLPNTPVTAHFRVLLQTIRPKVDDVSDHTITRRSTEDNA